jgi:hypothetical protein
LNWPTPVFVKAPVTVRVPCPSTLPLTTVIAPVTPTVVSAANWTTPPNAPSRLSEPASTGVVTVTTFDVTVTESPESGTSLHDQFEAVCQLPPLTPV